MECGLSLILKNREKPKEKREIVGKTVRVGFPVDVFVFIFIMHA